MIIKPRVLLTARIIYWLPDRCGLLQEFMLQHEDELPDLPRLWEFVQFWRTSVEGKLRRVEYAYRPTAGITLRTSSFNGTIQ